MAPNDVRGAISASVILAAAGIIGRLPRMTISGGPDKVSAAAAGWRIVAARVIGGVAESANPTAFGDLGVSTPFCGAAVLNVSPAAAGVA
jgi:hypothetical protein